MVATRRILHALVFALAALALSGLGESAFAAHYPPGATCTSCHALSSWQMYPSTRMLKRTGYSVSELPGYTGGPQVPCLYCHNLTMSASTALYMKPVDGHFSSNVTSKHGIANDSNFSDAAKFDCVDCHQGQTYVGGSSVGAFNTYVTADGSGNAKVHSIDTSSVHILGTAIYRTLTGTPATAADVSNAHCSNGSCHGGLSDNIIGGQTATKAHTFGNGTAAVKVTLGATGATANACTQCHASHRSSQQDKLMVLLDNGTVDTAQTAPKSSYVTPDKCSGCHVADDAAMGNDYGNRGHGQGTLTGGALSCTGCHDQTKPHVFTYKDPTGGAPNAVDYLAAKRFRASAIQDSTNYSKLTGKFAFSICTTCHSGAMGKIHAAGGANVACLDCHEVHGQGMENGVPAANGGYNQKMIRAKLPGKTETMVFVYGTGTAFNPDSFVDTNLTWGSNANGSSKGMCDNAECHAAATPYATFTKTLNGGAGIVSAVAYTQGTAHTGGNIGTQACDECHSHTDSSGSYGAADQSSCTTCHDYPPNRGAHLTHYTDNNIGCINCHPEEGKTNHNLGNWIANRAAYDAALGSNWAAIRGSATVGFGSAIVYKTGTITKGTTNYDISNTTCTNMPCHGSNLPAAAKGTNTAPRWSYVGATGDGACGTCHKVTVAQGGSQIATGSHTLHLAWSTASGAAETILCNDCHAAAVGTDGTTLLSAHVNGTTNSASDVMHGANFNGIAMTLTYSSGSNCSNISCHGSYTNVVWGASTGCANCHGMFDLTYGGADGMKSTMTPKHREIDITNGLGGNNTTTIMNSHKGAAAVGTYNEGYCDTCHANTQATYTGAATKKHIDGKIQLNNTTGFSWSSAPVKVTCTACHGAVSPYEMSEAGSITTLSMGTELITGAASGCSDCHGDNASKRYWPYGPNAIDNSTADNSGAHEVHIARLAAKVYSMDIANLLADADTSTKQKTLCEYCHYALTNDTDHSNTYPADVFYNGTAMATKKAKRLWDGADDADATFNYTSKVCTNVECHAQYGTVAAGSEVVNTPSWYAYGTARAYATASMRCSACHVDVRVTGTPTGTTHYLHDSSATAYGRTTTCATCHDAASVFNDPGTQPSSAHIDGTFNLGGAVSMTYVAGTFRTKFAGCGINSCHNNGQGTTADQAYTWGTTVSGTGSCTECHGNGVTDMQTQSHLVHMQSTSNNPSSCYDCHSAATVASHMNGTVTLGLGNVSFTYTGNSVYTLTGGTGNPGTVGTCGTNACHNNGQGGAPDYVNYTWGTSINGTSSCVECHGNTAATLAGQSHPTHISMGTTYGRTGSCYDCHPVNAEGQTTHVNGTVNLGTGNVSFTYTGNSVVVMGQNNPGTVGTCGTNTCHSANGAATAPVSIYTWGTALTDNCATCHLGTTIATYAHASHLNSNSLTGTNLTYGSTDECVDCHKQDSARAGRANSALHMNGTANVDFSFSTSYGYEASTAGRTGVGAATTCSTVKCHNGVTTPAWNATIVCGQCHNTSGAGPLPSAASVAGKHAKHANNDAVYTECEDCHANATTYTAKGGNASHENLVVNVSMTGITYTDATNAFGGVNYVAGTGDHVDNGNCNSTTGCHGASPTISWGATATITGYCFACHGQTEPTVKPDISNTAPNAISNTQYVATGHGHSGAHTGSGSTGAAFTVDLSNAAGNGCYKCHDISAGHSNTSVSSDPYRLGLQYVTGTGKIDTLCLQAGCHDTPVVTAHAKTYIGGTATWPNSYDFKCIDCHDPHGDGNWYMVRDRISAPTSAADTSFGSDQKGSPQDVTNLALAASAVTFTSTVGNGAASFGIDGSANGICEVCHASATDAQYYIRNNAGSNSHNTTSPCGSCHDHGAGFKGAGCSGCHGDSGSKRIWPVGANAAGDDANKNNSGAHEFHMARLSEKVYSQTVASLLADAATDTKQKTLCEYCHYALTNDTDHASQVMPAEVFNAPTMGVRKAKTLWGVDDTDASWNGTTYTCTNVDCHAQYGTTAGSEPVSSGSWYAFGTNRTYDTAQMRCASCHNDVTALTTSTGTSHKAHTSTTVHTITCDHCHSNAATMTWSAGTGVAPTANHMNGTFNISGSIGVTYGAATTFRNGFASCGTNRCHNSGMGSAPKTNYTWGTVIGGTGASCIECHGDTFANGMISQSHGVHMQSSANMPASCYDCHANAVAATHLDGTINLGTGGVSFTYTGISWVNMGSPGVNGVGACGTNACHNNGQGGTPDSGAAYNWGTTLNGTSSCTECHGNTAVMHATQSHPVHLQSTANNPASCYDCHPVNAESQSTHTNGTINVGGGYVTMSYGGNVNVVLGQNNVGTVGSCGTNKCHNNGQGGAADQLYTWGTSLGGTNSCTECHGNTAPLHQTQSHPVHLQSSSNNPASCYDCHPTNAQGLATHTDGTVNMAGGNVSFTYTGITWVNMSTPGVNGVGTCGTNTCHNNGQGGAADQLYTWGTSLGGTGSCTECHGNTAVMHQTQSHPVHLQSTSNNPASCYDCHPVNSETLTTHTNGTINVGGGYVTMTYGGNVNVVLGQNNVGTVGSCGTNKCHNNGQGNAGKQNYTWGTSIGGTNTCTECHSGVSDISNSMTLITQSHPVHMQSSSNNPAVCNDCHPANAQGLSSHVDGTINLGTGNFSFTYSGVSWVNLGTPGVNGVGSCGTNGCHNNGQGGAPDQGTYNWGTTYGGGTASCVECHGNTVATQQTQSHPVHLQSSSNNPSTCNDCHPVNAQTLVTHGNGTINVGGGNVTLSYTGNLSVVMGANNVGTVGTCGTNQCHNNGQGAAANQNYTWGTSINGTNSCTECHGNTGDVSNTMTLHTESHPKHTSATVPNTNCAKCHAAVSATSHTDGTINVGKGYGSIAFTYTGVTWVNMGTPGVNGVGTCTSFFGQCHGATTTPNWGNTLACGSCHGDLAANRSAYPDATRRAGAPPKDMLGYTGGTHVGQHLKHLAISYTQATTNSACQLCHNNAGSGTSLHADGTTNVAFTAYASGTAPNANYSVNTCANISPTNCHGSTTWNSTTTLSCAGCHAGVTTHVRGTRGGATLACTACHPGGTTFTTMHSTATGTGRAVLIPNYAKVGINYGHGSGIFFGGDVTFAQGTANTEAQMCWRCHDQNNDGDLLDATDISEWGTNTDSNGTSKNYNFGTLTNREWKGSTWTSAIGNFLYKRGTINPTSSAQKAGSIHTANPSGAPWNGPTANYDDTIAQIRCSYCHDVHNLKKAPGDTGNFMLRGSWMGNPFNEDGAPIAGFSFTTNTNNFGSVPRGGTTYTATGGFFINQNNGTDTGVASWSSNSSSGLCELCHGSGDGAWTSAEIGNLNVFGTMTDWTSGYNGHANSVAGGSGAGTGGEATARNIYNESKRSPNGIAPSAASDYQYAEYPRMGYRHQASRGAGFRGGNVCSRGWAFTPGLGAVYAFNSYNWAASTDNTTTDSLYHKFPCSKCHNPHASRLPRLLITNCLDTKKNTWDDAYSTLAPGANLGGTNTIPATTATTTRGWENANVKFSNATSAQNCHRVKDSNFGKTSVPTGGWNSVSPW